MKIFVDADACPVKIRELIYKTSLRLQLPVILVANKNMYFPRQPLLSLVVVDDSFDAADKYIVAQALAGDLVISSDILLASALVDNEVSVISSSGKIYDKHNVKEARATRDLMQGLREGRLVYGGPPPFGAKDLQNFANAFDRELTRLRKR